MCGRYDTGDGDEMQSIVEEINRSATRLIAGSPVKTGVIFPGDVAPALCLSRGGAVRPFPMRWGYGLSDGRRVINARSETAAQKPLFQDGIARRRCLLPMAAYFEWAHVDGGKLKYRIAPHGGPSYLAGVYRFEGTAPVFTVLTRPAAQDIAFIHDRMPVILSHADVNCWLLSGDCAPESAVEFRPEPGSR